MRKASVDVSVVLTLASRRAMMSKSIGLGLLGADAILLAILLTGCSDTPSPTPSAEAVPSPTVTAQPGVTPEPTPASTTAPTHTPTATPIPTAAPTPTPTPAGPTIIPLGLAPPVPGSCGNGTYDTPVPFTSLLGDNKSPSWRSDCAEIAYVQELGVSVMKRDGEQAAQ